MKPFFDNVGLNNLYLNSSKYAKKQQLLNAFYSVWYETCATNYVGLGGCPSWSSVRSKWNAENKKKIKVKLRAYGYTPQAIDALFKCMTQWLNANK
jgi:hypothetical protein